MEKFINLEKSQKNEVIGMIGAESFLNHFNSCKAGFAKLSSGISIQKLNSENVLDIAIAKSDEKLISDFADSFIEKSIKPIEKAVDDKKAYFEEEASLIAVCLLGTVYEGHEKLFFSCLLKISGMISGVRRKNMN